jgi:STE24 endopeptidase
VNVDKAVRYHRLKRSAGAAATLVAAVLLATLIVTGASARFRDLASAAIPRTQASSSASSSPVTIGIYVLLLCAIWQGVALPVAYYSGVVLERRYGLSSESTAHWLRDYAKAALLSTVVAVAAAEFLYWTIRRWPQHWWVAAAFGCGCAVLLLARAAPVVLLPLFYRFTPLERPPLQARLRALSDRAGMPVLGVYEWGLGDKTRRANAALVGVGGTRRILLSDTLLAGYSDDEIEVILAHELAHHAHRDVLKAVAAQTGLLLLGFAAGAWVVKAGGRMEGTMGFTGAGDVAALPLLLLAGGAVSVAMTPLIHALSRFHERRADAFALRLTGRPADFISAMRRLGVQNLVEPQPSRAIVWLFYSHPPIEERIERARALSGSC